MCGFGPRTPRPLSSCRVYGLSDLRSQPICLRANIHVEVPNPLGVSYIASIAIATAQLLCCTPLQPWCCELHDVERYTHLPPEASARCLQYGGVTPTELEQVDTMFCSPDIRCASCTAAPTTPFARDQLCMRSDKWDVPYLPDYQTHCSKLQCNQECTAAPNFWGG